MSTYASNGHLRDAMSTCHLVDLATFSEELGLKILGHDDLQPADLIIGYLLS